jgi:hypothetical protein
MSVLNRRPSRAWSSLLALLAGVIVSAAAASPALAQIPTTLIPTISGSGILSSSGGACSATNAANGTLTPCSTFVIVSPNFAPMPMAVTATPQPSPAGHWHFVRWEGNVPCTTSPTCVIPGPGFTGKAVFEDLTGPTVTLPAESGPGEGALQVANSATFTPAANEAATFQCRLDAADFTACPSPTTLTALAPGAHRFDVRAIDLSGNVGEIVSRTWAVAAPDLDSDGFNSLVDCDETNSGIRPGAVEINDNAIDENCDGLLGTTPPVVTPNTPRATEQVVVTLAFFANAKKTTTKFTTLQVKNVPLGATVNVTCGGKGCPSGLKGKGFTKTNAFGTVTLAKFIKKPLKAGDVITVVVSKPNAISAIKILTVRASKKPLITTKCQPPGAKSPVAC